MNVPILGQVKVGEDWFLTIPIECTCGAHFLVAGQVGTTRPCPNPSCQKLVRIARLPTENPDGSITWHIATRKVV